MKKAKYIFPVLIYSRLFAQQDQEVMPNIEFGFSNSTFASITTISSGINPVNHFQRDAAINTGKRMPVSQADFGFNYGVFLWVKASDKISIKPEFNASFSNYKFKDYLQNNTKNIYATSFDLSVANQVIVNLKPVNTHGMIKVAKCMSYYLTSKQPYLLIGPKLSYRKFDRGFLQKGFQNEASIGVVVGYGINYGFHNMNFAPEIKYSLETSAQNTMNNSKKITQSITLAFNLF